MMAHALALQPRSKHYSSPAIVASVFVLDTTGAVNWAALGAFQAVLGSTAMSNGKKDAEQSWRFLSRWLAMLPIRVLSVRQRQIGQRLFMVASR
jgi:hypothetical protein